MRSSVEDEATHFGPRSHVRACAACGTARNSVRRRTSVAAVTLVAKLTGSLRLACILDRGKHVGGPVRKNSGITSAGVIGMPTRVNHPAATAAAICSLSTSTPLHSKMITPGPRHAPRRRVDWRHPRESSH
jgi:hypothetical protein